MSGNEKMAKITILFDCMKRFQPDFLIFMNNNRYSGQ